MANEVELQPTEELAPMTTQTRTYLKRAASQTRDQLDPTKMTWMMMKTTEDMKASIRAAASVSFNRWLLWNF
jgi:chorismate mutase